MQLSEPVMGTVVSLAIREAETAAAAGTTTETDDAAAQAIAVLHHVDRVFSTWKPNSPLSRLRRGEITLADAPPEVGWVIELCRRARAASGGWFDPWAPARRRRPHRPGQGLGRGAGARRAAQGGASRPP